MMALHTRNAVRVPPENIPRLALMLRRIGFAEPFFQEWRIGQRFGLSRPLTSILEWHVRGFADGTVDSEVEISRKRLEHVAARPGSYYWPLLTILRSHSIPFWASARIPPDTRYVYLPETFGRRIPVGVPHTI
jgi:hypothetical protein